MNLDINRGWGGKHLQMLLGHNSQVFEDNRQVHTIMHREIPTDQSSDRHAGNQVPRQNYLGQIARLHGEKYIKVYNPPIDHIKFIRALRVCKTPALGGKKITCNTCGEEHTLYFSPLKGGAGYVDIVDAVSVNR